MCSRKASTASATTASSPAPQRPPTWLWHAKGSMHPRRTPPATPPRLMPTQRCGAVLAAVVACTSSRPSHAAKLRTITHTCSRDPLAAFPRTAIVGTWGEAQKASHLPLVDELAVIDFARKKCSDGGADALQL